MAFPGSMRRVPTAPPPAPVPLGKPKTSDSNQEITEARLNPLAWVLATGGGAGYAPVASGTFGSLVGVLIYPLVSGLSVWLYLLASLALLGAGIWAADAFERVHGVEDDGRIVIDEIVGQLLTYLPFVALGFSAGWPWLVTGFVVFRGFDIWKPGPARWAEQELAGGAGVMLDDVAAGLMAAGVMTLLIQVAS